MCIRAKEMACNGKSYQDRRYITRDLELSTLKMLKSVLDRDITADKQMSSKCLALLYQPKRSVSKETEESKK